MGRRQDKPPNVGLDACYCWHVICMLAAAVVTTRWPGLLVPARSGCPWYGRRRDSHHFNLHSLSTL
jgi:hypothetical protein